MGDGIVICPTQIVQRQRRRMFPPIWSLQPLFARFLGGLTPDMSIVVDGIRVIIGWIPIGAGHGDCGLWYFLVSEYVLTVL